MTLDKREDSNPCLPNKKSLFLFAGEQSGDTLGAELIIEIKKRVPSLEIEGVGGFKMSQAGLKCLFESKSFEVMGISDVLKKLPQLYQKFQKVKNYILKSKPEAVIFIDYPEFNMKMAKALRRGGFNGKLIHYVSPSVWAWREGRVKSLSKTLDLLLTILPFEAEYYKKTALSVSYVGHPLVSHVDNYIFDPNWRGKLDIAQERPLLALFPGSRVHEIERNLPLQCEAIKHFSSDFLIAISSARDDLSPLIKKIAGDGAKIVPHTFCYELMREAKAALATSGTIILELGLFGVPTVATYKLGALNYFLGRYLFRIKLPHFTLVNIICNKTVFPEFIHKNLTPHNISQAFKKLLQQREACIKECQTLRAHLQKHNASQKAAQKIVETLT